MEAELGVAVESAQAVSAAAEVLRIAGDFQRNKRP
jgi:hypothetical protein